MSVRRKAIKSSEAVLGKTVYRAMEKGRCTWITIAKAAAEKAFIDNRQDEHAENLRTALDQLDRYGACR